MYVFKYLCIIDTDRERDSIYIIFIFIRHGPKGVGGSRRAATGGACQGAIYIFIYVFNYLCIIDTDREREILYILYLYL